jgi:hypothetical protein
MNENENNLEMSEIENKPQRFQRTRLASLAGLDLRRISEAREDDEPNPQFRSPFFTLTAKDGEYLHYSAHIREKNNNGNNSAESADEKEKGGTQKLQKNNRSNSLRKNSLQNKLVNVKATIEDESSADRSADNNSYNSDVGSRRNRGERKSSIFDIFPEIGNKPIAKEKSIDVVEPVESEEKTIASKTEVAIEHDVENITKIKSLEDVTPTEKIDLRLKEQNDRRKSNFRFSIVNDNQTSPNKTQQKKRRKSLHPSEAFNTSEEVTKARRLSIFAPDSHNNKQTQHITIKRDDYGLHSSGTNGVILFFLIFIIFFHPFKVATQMKM